MSFKRDANDDVKLHHALRKRLVEELFAVNIPENEAKLCSNGRYSCTVCKNYPIFDTVKMLHHHRQGRKHKYYDSLWQSEKRSLIELGRKRQHDCILKHDLNGVKKIAEQLEDQIPGSSTMLCSSSYNPSVKKRTRYKSDQPRQQINLKNITTKKNTSEIKIKSGRQSDVLCHPKSSPSVCHKTDMKETFRTCDDGKKYSAPKDLVNDSHTGANERAEKYIELRSSGWIKDLRGNWVKEDGVEFDSDEEPPDVP